MSHNICDLLLGTDLFDRKKNLVKAKALIKSNVGSIVYKSKILETEPIGFTSNTLFLNQIITIETRLSPISLLNSIKKIEQEMGRMYIEPKNGEKYSSRIIDVDILKYNNIIYESERLKIPHPQVIERSFIAEIYNK